MKNHTLFQFFIAFVYFTLSLSSVSAQPETKSAFREIPTLKLNIYQTDTSINSPMDGEIILTNLTNKTYDVQSVKVFLPEGLASIRPKFKNKINKELHAINAEDERIYSFGIPRVEMPLWQSIWDLNTLLFVPGTYRLRAEVILKKSGQDTGTRSLYASTELNLEPPLLSALRGGIIGALLLALFVPAYRALQQMTSQTVGILARESAKQFIIYVLSGSVVSIIAILIIHRVGSANLPISISVNDYLGGILVGLFSYVIGNSLYNQFFKKDTANKPGK